MTQKSFLTFDTCWLLEDGRQHGHGVRVERRGEPGQDGTRNDSPRGELDDEYEGHGGGHVEVHVKGGVLEGSEAQDSSKSGRDHCEQEGA